jgi:hypothetical protein
VHVDGWRTFAAFALQRPRPAGGPKRALVASRPFGEPGFRELLAPPRAAPQSPRSQNEPRNQPLTISLVDSLMDVADLRDCSFYKVFLRRPALRMPQGFLFSTGWMHSAPSLVMVNYLIAAGIIELRRHTNLRKIVTLLL